MVFFPTLVKNTPSSPSCKVQNEWFLSHLLLSAPLTIKACLLAPILHAIRILLTMTTILERFAVLIQLIFTTPYIFKKRIDIYINDCDKIQCILYIAEAFLPIVLRFITAFHDRSYFVSYHTDIEYQQCHQSGVLYLGRSLCSKDT